MNSHRACCQIVCISAITLAAWSVGLRAAKAPSKPTTHTVVMDANRYMPQELTVKAGDTVVWINKDVVAHTATSSAAGFDSGSIQPGASWKYTAKRAGDFPYSCTFHPLMTGTLRVN